MPEFNPPKRSAGGPWNKINLVIWPHRLAWSRTLGSQPINTGSNPVGAILVIVNQILLRRTLGLPVQNYVRFFGNVPKNQEKVSLMKTFS